ncbi:MAG: ATP-binding protein [Nanoarchaeota archaeon]
MKNFPEKYIERELENKINKYLKDREIIAILGTRQCGKTTLMKHIFKKLKNSRFISFEDRDILNLFTKDIKTFAKRYVEKKDYLFIDEFQYAKKGGQNLKFLYDTYKIKIIISGSSAPELSVQSLKYLVGRILIFNLHPLSFKEFLNYKDKNLLEILLSKKEKLTKEIVKLALPQYREYLTFGGYPKIVAEKDLEKKQEFLKNIYNTYLLREIKEILQIEEDQKVNSLIKTLALQCGSQVNYNEISNLINLENYELKKYLEILKKTFICIETKPYFKNKRKELSKTPKIYFVDNGFRNIAIDNFQDIENRTDRGALNENFVCSELFKKDLNFKYWRTKAGAEIDFVIEKQNKLIPIEVKTTLKTPKHGKSFENFIKEYPIEKGFFLSEDYIDKLIKHKIKIIFNPIFNIFNLL